MQGVARFSQTLNERDAQLRNLLSNANKATAVLSERSDQIVGLLADSNALLIQLQTQHQALDQISGNITAVSQQIKGLISENRQTLKPALDKLNGVLTILDNRKDRLQLAIKKFNDYAMSLGESMSSGPFFKFYIANLLPGQFVQPFVDAAFSDLGLDPNVLLPSQLSDPQIGQPGTPALPMPYPRTGQGGEPRLNLPDAITGKPGDPRYPYREPPPAPPPGGPPPGPPAEVIPAPTPTRVYVPAPGEVPEPADGRATMSRGNARIGLAVMLVLTVVAGVVVMLQSSEVARRTTVVAYFENSNGIFVGDEVRILGVPVGKIDKIEPQPQRVKITFFYDDKYQVPADAKAVILSPSLVTARAIQLTPAYTGGPRCRATR